MKCRWNGQGMEPQKEDNADKIYKLMREEGSSKTLMIIMYQYIKCWDSFRKTPVTSELDSGYRSCGFKNAILTTALGQIEQGKESKGQRTRELPFICRRASGFRGGSGL